MTDPQNPQPGPQPYPAAQNPQPYPAAQNPQPYPLAQNPAGGQPYYPMPGYLPAPEPKGLSTASMVLALVSVVFGFTFLLPITALILGIVGLRREPAGRGMAIAGVVISGLILVVWAILLIVLLVVGLSAFGIAVSQTTS
ncbi:protein of unknown function [Microbacterium azadirachtae]|uniref:DUF4190 domain-containing protein n=1 Tax=Microbacterium azadirachtae TaxID=582680 RepID=A0A1I6HJT2_9MICO|nr:DUF4190 domain-containing protein [Microbacterium azadirachtae]SFR54749.1 protein of unknown function [Microbacterium azadirachtae]